MLTNNGGRRSVTPMVCYRLLSPSLSFRSSMTRERVTRVIAVNVKMKSESISESEQSEGY